MGINFPGAKDSWVDVANGIDHINDVLWRHAGSGIAVVVEAIQDFIGYDTDEAAPTAGVGSLNERVIRLEGMNNARFFFQMAAPDDPELGDFWVHIGITPWAIGYYDGSTWNMLGASCQEIGGVPVSISEPVAGFVLGYDPEIGAIVLQEPSEFNIVSAAGQLVVGDEDGNAFALTMGEYGQFVQPKQDGTGVEWSWPIFRAFQQVGLSTPTAPTVTPQGVGGATTYNYYIVAVDARRYRTLPSTAGTTTTGNAALSGTNFNRLTWPKVNGAASYQIFRGSPTALVDEVSALTYDDIGDSTSVLAAPVRNETLDIAITGFIRANGAVVEVENGLTAAPALSAVNGSRIYYDKTLEKWRVSVHGEAYTDFGASGSAGHTIQDAAEVSYDPRSNLRFAAGDGIDVDVEDDEGEDATIVTITATGGGGSSEPALHPFLFLSA